MSVIFVVPCLYCKANYRYCTVALIFSSLRDAQSSSIEVSTQHVDVQRVRDAGLWPEISIGAQQLKLRYVDGIPVPWDRTVRCS